MPSTIISRWFKKCFLAADKRKFCSSQSRLFRPSLEQFESRLVPTTLTVMNDADSGSGSLRATLALAQPGDTIDFATNVNDIVLTSGGLTIASNVTIVNDQSSGLITIDGGGNSTVFTVSSGVTASIADLSIIDGDGSDGGGIDNAGVLTLNNCALSNNTASGGQGGGLYNTGQLVVSLSTLNSNSAGAGGGIDNASTGIATISNCTFINNTAEESGGAIYGSGAMTATDSTFTGNSATQGGGIFASGSTLVSGDIIVGNVDGAVPDDVAGNALVSSSRDNLVGADLTSSLVNGVNGNQVGVTVAQAGLSPLGWYGGPTETVAVLPGSLAIGAGLPFGGQNPMTDQRGMVRPSGTPGDVGAFQTVPLTVNTIVDANSVATGQLSLRDAIDIVNADDTSSSEPITFDPTVFASPQTVTLAGGLSLGGSGSVASISITGPASGVTLDGGNQFTIFTTYSGVSASLTNLTVSGGSGVNGGGIYNQGTLTLSDCDFSSDIVASATQESNGGAILNYEGTTTITDCTFSDCSAANYGGAILNYQGTMTISGSTFTDDASSAYGGAIGNYFSSLTISSTTFANNSAGLYGGAIINDHGPLKLSVSTIYENTAGPAGGGIFNSGSMSATDNTIFENSAGTTGGGLYTSGSSLLNGDILVGNTDGSGIDDIAGSSLSPASSDNLVGGDLTNSLTNGVKGNQLGVSIAEADLGTLASNGGPTETLALLPGSLALGKGFVSTTITDDQRGVPRPVDEAGDAGAFELSTAPLITTNPSSVVLDAGQNTSFSSAATDIYTDGATTVPTTVQWMISTDGGQTFSSISSNSIYSGVTTPTLTITGATAGMNGDQYEAVYTNPVGETGTTTAAALNVYSAPTITSNPTSTTTLAGGSASFSASANGYPAPTVLWYVNTGSGYTPLSDGGVYSGSSTDSLTITGAAADMNGYTFEAIFSNNQGQPATTTAATLTVDSPITITGNPASVTINAGGSTTFTASASGFPLPNVQWYVNQGNGFTALSNSGVYSGTSTDALTITGATAAMNGYSYRAVFSNVLISGPDSVPTTPAVLTVDVAPTITSNPVSVSVDEGLGATFSAAATGYPTPTVFWQVSTNNGTSFSPIGDGGIYSGASTDMLSIASVDTAMNGYEYEAVFSNTISGTNTPSTATSKPAVLTIAIPGSTATSIVTVSNSTLEAGGTITVNLQTKDAEGNDFTTGGLTVGFGLESSQGGQGTFSAVTDNANGTYSAVFTGTLAGSNTITATIGGQAVTTSLPSIKVTPGSVSPTHSFLSLSLPSVQLGGVATITLQAEDAYGNKEPSGGLSVAFKLENTQGGYGVFSPVTDNANGTYTATFTGAVDGSNVVEATVETVGSISSSPSISVSGTAFSLAKSLVGLSESSVQAGGTTTVTLQAEGSNGVKETSGGLSIAFRMGSPTGGHGTFSAVTDNGNGTYTASFTGTLVGGNTIAALIDGQLVASTEPAIAVTTGPVSLANSVLMLSSATAAAGSAVTITLRPEDAYGNLVNSTTLGVTVSIGSVSGAQGTFSATKHNANGMYTGTFTGIIAGGNAISASIGGNAITSPLPVISVTPGPASVAKSLVSLAIGTVQSGGTSTVTLQAEDAFGNMETSGGLAVLFKLGSASGAKGTFSSVTDHKNGAYTATFTGTIAGTNTIDATIAGVRVTTGAPTIEVTPGPYSLLKSLVLLSSSSVESGRPITVTLQAEDAYGNKLTTGGLDVQFLLGGTSGGQGSFGSVTDHGNGTYTAVFTATSAGSNTIKALIDDLPVSSIPPIIKVKPA